MHVPRSAQLRYRIVKIIAPRRNYHSRPMGTGPRVLIVEDDDSTREMLCTVLNESNFDIVAALDGTHALRTSLAKRPDVILLDLGLPELDGSGYLRQLRERDETAGRIPVIVTSGSPYGRQIAEELGAALFFSKPFDLDELVAAITRLASR